MCHLQWVIDFQYIFGEWMNNKYKDKPGTIKKSTTHLEIFAVLRSWYLIPRISCIFFSRVYNLFKIFSASWTTMLTSKTNLGKHFKVKWNPNLRSVQLVMSVNQNWGRNGSENANNVDREREKVLIKDWIGWWETGNFLRIPKRFIFYLSFSHGKAAN